MEYESFEGEFYVNGKIYYHVGLMCGDGKDVSYVHDPDTNTDFEVPTIEGGNYILLDGVKVRSWGQGDVPKEVLDQMPQAYIKANYHGLKKGRLYPIVKELEEGAMLRVDGFEFHYVEYDDMIRHNQIGLFQN